MPSCKGLTFCRFSACGLVNTRRRAIHASSATPESYLEGAEYLAAHGIGPIASIRIPFGRPVMGRMETPRLDYYRKVKEGLAEVYVKYGIEPPGSIGINVCVCRDIWNHRSDIIGCRP